MARAAAVRETLLVMAGAAIGGAARYHAGRLSFHLWGAAWPWGTLIVNLLGGLLMGLLAGVLARHSDGEWARLLIGVGVLGGFTTFSAFSLETWLMLSRGQLASAGGYALASVAGSVLALYLGLLVARSFA